MDTFYARAVFFVQDAEAALAFYTEKLGFSLDWNHQHEGRAWVFQVSLHGFELILNQVWAETTPRAGHGRVFVGIEGEQTTALREHMQKHEIPAYRDDWGNPTLVILDPDGNQLYFWVWNDEWVAQFPPLPR